MERDCQVFNRAAGRAEGDAEMMMQRTGAIAGFALLLATWTHAQEAPKPGPPPPNPAMIEKMFQQADTDKDGKLTLEEFRTAVPKLMPARRPQGTPAGQRLEMLRKADQDRDGKVTAEEFKAAFPKAPETRFKEMDRNGDGVLTHEDAPAGPATAKPPAGQGPRFDAKLLKEADADQDGKVTIEEARKLRPGLPDEAFKRMDADHDGALTEEDVKIQHKQAQEERRARMISADTDGDKKLSLEEAKKAFPGITEDEFKKRDKNADGFISEEDQAGKRK